MTLRQTLQAAPAKTTELIEKLSATSNQAVKARETLFTGLSEELARYVEIEEQHLLPLLRKHPETKDLAVEAAKGNKDLRARLAKLAAAPKDDDTFLVQLAELNKSFQQHVRNERKELLPAVLKALSDEEAGALAGNMEGAVAAAEQAKRDAKREEANEAKRQAEQEEQAAAACRAEVRAQKATERTAREATEKVAGAIESGAASVQEGARNVAASITERAQQGALQARDAMTVLSGSAQQIVEDLQAVRASSAVSATAVAEIRSVWVDWFSQASRANAEAVQQLLRCKSVKQLAEFQRDFVTGAVRSYMEGSTKVLQITQRTSKQALAPLDRRLTDAA